MTTPTAEQRAISELIQSSHAAIYAYGIVAGYATNQDAAYSSLAAHRHMRDWLITVLATSGGSVPPSAAAYTLPLNITTTASASTVATQLENGMCAQWAAHLPSLERTRKSIGAKFAQDCAVRAFTWSHIALAFPGSP